MPPPDSSAVYVPSSDLFTINSFMVHTAKKIDINLVIDFGLTGQTKCQHTYSRPCIRPTLVSSSWDLGDEQIIKLHFQEAVNSKQRL
mmetsp:Transcript_27741/g.33918  ORF Transcript_27741/g.33918 Transcript_27741/m.33918 type:complete len:87 (+) Transcript_27741:351-611(+)